MNIRRKWLPVLLAMVFAIFAMQAHASNAPESEPQTSISSSTHQMHGHPGHQEKRTADGCVTGCCTIGLCCFLTIAFQDTNPAVYTRNIFATEDAPSWQPLTARPPVPPPKSV